MMQRSKHSCLMNIFSLPTQFLPMLSVVLLMYSSFSYADPQGDTYYQHVDQAKAWAKMQPDSIDVHDYCKGSNCNEVDNPSAQKYYGDDAGTTTAAKQKAFTDDDAKSINTANQHRQTIDGNDPDYVNASHVMEDGYEISHGKAGKYTDCTKHQSCTNTSDTRNCTTPVEGAEPKCHSYPVEDKISQSSKTESLPFNTSFKAERTLSDEAAVITSITIPTITGHPNDAISHGNYTLVVNGKRIGVLQTTWFWTALKAVIKGKTFHTKIQGKSFHFSLSGRVNIHTSFTAKIHYVYHTHTMKWVNDCGAVPPECAFNSPEVCIEDGGTRNINGIDTTMDCWKKERTYQCHYDDTCQSLPKASEKATLSRFEDDSETHCIPTGNAPTCALKVLGVCVENKQTYSCNTRSCQTANITCGEPSFCLDGDCYAPDASQSDDFAKNAAIMAAINQAGKDITAEDMKAFSGKAVSCSKKPIGIANCCSGKGWGMDIDLTSCTDEEKALMKAKKKHIVHTVGSYCAEKVLGICIRHKEMNCQYPNLLSKLVAEQGKPQLHQNYGSAKHPNCAGFTADEMSHIDFSKIDLSEFYPEMKSNTNLPDPADVQKKAQDDAKK